MRAEQKEAVKSYFTDISADYSQVYDVKYPDSIRSYIFLTRKKYVLEMLDQCGGRVLDIGCGPAVLTEELVKRNCEVWGIDISENMIEYAERKAEDKGIQDRAHFSVGDAERLEFPDKYFDFILCIGVLEYLKDDSIALKEINRVLKDGGKAIFTVPNLVSPFVLLDRAVLIIVMSLLKLFIKVSTFFGAKIKIPDGKLLFRGDIVTRYYYPWAFNKTLKNNEFTVVDSMFHAYRLSLLSAVAPNLLLFFCKRLEVLSKSPLDWMGINYIVKISKG